MVRFEGDVLLKLEFPFETLRRMCAALAAERPMFVSDMHTSRSFGCSWHFGLGPAREFWHSSVTAAHNAPSGPAATSSSSAAEQFIVEHKKPRPVPRWRNYPPDALGAESVAMVHWRETPRQAADLGHLFHIVSNLD